MNKLPLVQKMMVDIVKGVPSRIHMRHIDVSSDKYVDRITRRMEIELSVKLFARTVVDEDVMRPDNINTLMNIRRSAAGLIANEIYGPIEKELIEVLRELWEDGLFENHPAVIRINEIIKSMKEW